MPRKTRRSTRHKETSVLGVLWRVAKFPFQALGVFLAVVMVISWALLFQLPGIATSTQSDTFLLSLRVLDLDSERSVWPLYALDPKHEVDRTALKLRPPPDPESRYYSYVADLLKDNPVTPEAKQAALREVRQLYDLDDPDTQKTFLAWANGLLQVGLYQGEHSHKIWHETCPRTELTLDEACLLALPVLHGIQPLAAEDLPRLDALFQEAYPEETDRQTALAWAEARYDRMAQLHRDFLDRQNPTDRKLFISRQNNLNAQDINQVLPPRTPLTLRWLIYQHVGLDDASRRTATNYWMTFFPAERLDRIRPIANRLSAQRRQADDPLPPSSPAVPWLCVIDHYQGLDRAGVVAREKILERYSRIPRNYLAGALKMGNPSDDLYFIQAGTDPMKLLGDEIGFCGLLNHSLIVFLVVYGVRLTLFPILAEFLLRLHHKKEYRSYRDGRGQGDLRVRLVGYIGVPLLAWAITWFYLPEQLLPVAGSPSALLLACFSAVLIGGILVGACTRLAAILMLRVGIDVERVWYDEIVGLFLGVGLLAYFGNDPVSIAVFVLAEVLPMILQPPAGPEEVPVLEAVDDVPIAQLADE